MPKRTKRPLSSGVGAMFVNPVFRLNIKFGKAPHSQYFYPTQKTMIFVALGGADATIRGRDCFALFKPKLSKTKFIWMIMAPVPTSVAHIHFIH